MLFVGKRSKIWYFQKEVGGQTRRVLVGRFPVISAVAARQASLGFALNSADVLDVLYPLLLRYGKPEYVRSDNGSEFVTAALQDWLRKVGIKPIQIPAGSPWENGYNGRFNGTLRREILNAEWFHTTKQAQIVINAWLRQ